MWTCPKCKRQFKKTNQGHYCGKAPENVDEYINLQDKKAHNHLDELRKTITNIVPGATEQIAWSMPTYKKDNASISFVACKNHISFYADAEILNLFKQKLADFEIKKNALYLPFDKTLPLQMIQEIIKQSFSK